MAFFDFWKRRESKSSFSGSDDQRPPVDRETYLPIVAIVNNSEGKLTTIEGEDFRLDLPFRWEQIQNERSLEFRNEIFSEQLIITARRTREGQSELDRGQLLAKMIQVQQDALKQAARVEIRISAAEQVHRGSESEGRFYAKSKEMLMAFGIRYIPDRVFTFSLYRYTHQDFGMPFGQYAGTILDLLKIKPR